MDYDTNFLISFETKLTDERWHFTRLETFMTSNIDLNQMKQMKRLAKLEISNSFRLSNCISRTVGRRGNWAREVIYSHR